MRFDNMVLYIKPGCPFCSKVMLFMEENGIEMKILDSTEPGNGQALLDMNGTTQVPCLVVDDKPMLESDDIVQYLEDMIS